MDKFNRPNSYMSKSGYEPEVKFIPVFFFLYRSTNNILIDDSLFWALSPIFYKKKYWGSCLLHQMDLHVTVEITA